MPAILVNSPFRGVANGTGILAASFPGGPGYPTHGGDYGIGGPNGTANGAFFAVNLSIRNLANVSEWGPGQNAPCSLPLAVLPEPPPRGTSTGLTIPVPSNLTDQGEATTVNLSGLFIGSQNVPSWNNAFTWSNSPNVSTCGRAGETLNVSSYGLHVGFPVTLGGIHWIVPFVLPFKETYRYSFPSNGTWAIDNLSEPGGPGGGWAFDYLGPCV